MISNPVWKFAGQNKTMINYLQSTQSKKEREELNRILYSIPEYDNGTSVQRDSYYEIIQLNNEIIQQYKLALALELAKNHSEK